MGKIVVKVKGDGVGREMFATIYRLSGRPSFYEDAVPVTMREIASEMRRYGGGGVRSLYGLASRHSSLVEKVPNDSPSRDCKRWLYRLTENGLGWVKREGLV